MNRGTGVPRRSGLLALNLNGSRASFDAQAGHRAATPGFPGAKLLTEGIVSMDGFLWENLQELVGGWAQPPWKIWVRQIGSSSQLLGKIKNVPNHQPGKIEVVYMFFTRRIEKTDGFPASSQSPFKPNKLDLKPSMLGFTHTCVKQHLFLVPNVSYCLLSKYFKTPKTFQSLATQILVALGVNHPILKYCTDTVTNNSIYFWINYNTVQYFTHLKCVWSI